MKRLLLSLAIALVMSSHAGAQAPRNVRAERIDDRIPNAASSVTSILSLDTITVSRASHTLAAETGTADDLCTVVTTGMVIGHETSVVADAGDTITIKNGGACNITTDTGADIVLSGAKRAKLFVTAAGVDALSSGGSSAKVTSVANKAALAALEAGEVTQINSVIVAEDSYGGVFQVVTTDISTQVTGDPAAAIYVPFSGGNGSTGGFVRLDYLQGIPLQASWFGVDPVASASVNGVALDRWLSACAGRVCAISSGVFTTDAEFVPRDGTTIYAGGAFMWFRSGFTTADTSPTVIRGDGTVLTGANSTVGRFSKTAVGVAGTDFSAPGTDELRDVTIIGGMHFDANGADYAAVYYRCQGCDLGLITHSGANVAGFGMWGTFELARIPTFGTFENNGHGCIIGEEGPNTAYGAEVNVYNTQLEINSIGNGGLSSYAKFTNDEVGSGCIIAAGRGSKVTISSEQNAGRAFIIRNSAGTGTLDIVQRYVEGNAEGALIDDYDTNYQKVVFHGGFNHPGNGNYDTVYELATGSKSVFTIAGGAGLTVNDIEVFLDGVKQTPTTQYTVADNVADLDVTIVAGAPAANVVVHMRAYDGSLDPQNITIKSLSTDGGPAASANWVIFKDFYPASTTSTGSMVVHSNTYRYYVEDTPASFVTYSHRPATKRGVFASGYISWNTTVVSQRTDAQAVGNISLSRIAVGNTRLIFPPDLVQYGQGGTKIQNYQCHFTIGQSSTLGYLTATGTNNAYYCELRLYDTTSAAPFSLTDTAAAVVIKYTITRIDE